MAGPSAGAQSSWTDGTDMNDTQESSSPSKVRDFVVDWLRKELVGPAPGYPMVQLNGEEILRPQDPPRYRYGCGILFPQGVRYSGGEPIDDGGSSTRTGRCGRLPLTLARTLTRTSTMTAHRRGSSQCARQHAFNPFLMAFSSRER
jgi:hypothetical protein